MSATITSTGQWTKLATDLHALQDTALPATGNIPALNPLDLGNGLPPELHSFIVEASKGFARSFFENTDVATGTTFLEPLTTALLIRQLLTFYIQRGFPGHDGIGTRGGL